MKHHLTTLTACLILCAAPFAAAAEKPNIIVILVDDMGFSDLSCYGSETPTPNLDALASNGMRFTQFYNTGRCCPTRASLLTGLYPHQAGVGHMVQDRGAPGYVGHLNDACVTLAEVLKPAGYFTAFSGKWHVGQDAGVTPWNRGFDRSLNAAAGGFYFPSSPRSALFLNGEKLANDDKRLPADWYSTDLWTTFGMKFIDEALAAKKPFYLHLCHNAPHFPLQAPAKEIAKFRGKYKAGWDAIGAARYARQLELGIIDAGWDKSPRSAKVREWQALSAEEQDRFDHIMAVYAAALSHMDKSVGDLVAGLKQRGVFDNTLILFMSDNGGNAESGPNGKTNGDPSQGNSDWFCGEAWAAVQNTPFRLFKHYNHEGGVATPLIAHWPKGINVDHHGNRSTNFSRKTPGGPLCHTPAHLIDVMATCVDITGATYPKEMAGHPIQPMEGVSLKNLFLGGEIQRGPLYWEHEGNAAIRVGDQKLVRNGRNGAWELYDMKADRTELHDLAASNPDTVKDLATKWETWAERAHVKPYPATGEGKKRGNQKKAPANGGGVPILQKAKAAKMERQADTPDRNDGGSNSHIYKIVGKNKLELYVDTPKGHRADAKVPAIVFFHGGGFKTGSVNQFERQSEHLAERGMVAIRVRYRLTSDPSVQIKDCVEDAKSAMRWVRANAGKLGVDPDRIAAGGGSAGGYLSAATLLIDFVNAETDPPGVSARPNAMVLFNPAFGRPNKEDCPDPRDPEGKGDLKKYVKPDQPPMIQFFGTEDLFLPGARVFMEAYKKAGNRCELFTYDGEGHSFFNKDKYLELTLAETDRFLVNLGWLEKRSG